MLAWSAAALGAGLMAVVAYDARQIARLRRERGPEPMPLDHTALVGEGLGEPLDLIVLGDSAAGGYGNADAREAFPYQVAAGVAAATGARVRVDSLAVSGATTEDVTVEQVPQLVQRQPDVVVVSVGVNDAFGRRRARTARRQLGELLSRLSAATPEAGIVVVGCPDLSGAPGLPWPLNVLGGWRCRRIRGAQAAAAADAGVAFIAYPDPPDPGMFGPDGLHPGPVGQAAAAGIVAPVVADVIRTDRPT